MSIQKPVLSEHQLREIAVLALTGSYASAKMALEVINKTNNEVLMNKAELDLYKYEQALAYVKKEWNL